mgnify:CR=1 FL=1
MAQEITNFARFYATFNKIPYGGDREEFKKEMVKNATLGRTDSLREVTRREYEDICQALEKCVPDGETVGHSGGRGGGETVGRGGGETVGRGGGREELRRWRSICLKLMQKLGIDTTDWNRINAFCQDGRIAGKVFAQITTEELEVLAKKLRSIERKGGLRELPAADAPGTVATARVVELQR